MKKWKLICFILVVIVVVPIVGYTSYIYIRVHQANTQIDQAIKKLGIPQNEIVVLKKTAYNAQPLFSAEWFPKTITTKKDYETWKNIVLKNKRYLNGHKLKNKDAVNSIKNCEITYDFTYRARSKSVEVDCIYGENSATKQQIQEYFSYRILDKFKTD